MKQGWAIAVVAAGLLSVSAPAWAHARRVSAVPAADSSGAAPQEIILTFNEGIKLIACKMTGADGKDVTGVGAPLAEGKSLKIPVTAPLVAGKYTVSYRIAGDDGHAMDGTYTFTVAAP